MAIAIRGISTPSAGASPRSLPMSTGTVEGDTIYAQLSHAVAGVVITPPAGFTLVPGAIVAGATKQVSVYQKVVGSGETGPYSFSWTGGGSGRVVSITLSSDFPLILDGVNTATTDVASSTKTWATVSPASASAFLMCFGSFSVSTTPDAAMSERFDASETTGLGIYLMTQQLTAAGATGTRTGTGGSTAFQRTITLAVAEDSPIVQARVTQAGLYVEVAQPAAAVVTQAGLYVEAYDPDAAPYLSIHPVNSRKNELSWVDNGDPGDTYELQYSLNDVDWNVLSTTLVTGAIYTQEFLTPNTLYYYRVRRVLGGIDGAWSTTVSLTTGHPVLYRVSAAVTGGASPRTVSNTGIQEGDLVLLAVGLIDNIAPLTVPAGFTLLVNTELATANNIRVYAKIATAAEPTYTVTFASGNGALSVIALYSDSGQVLEVADSAAQANASSTSRVYPSVTPARVGGYLANMGFNVSNITSVADALCTEYEDLAGTPRTYVMGQTYAPATATGTRTATGTAVASRTASIFVNEVDLVSVPADPSGFTVTPVGYDKIQLAWTDNSSNEAGFEIWRRLAGETAYTLIHTTYAGTETYLDTGLTLATEYEYLLRAVNGYGGGSFLTGSATTYHRILLRGYAENYTGTTPITVDLPVGTLPGELMFIIAASAARSLADPDGWAYVEGVDTGVDSYQTLKVWSRIATVSEPANFTIDVAVGEPGGSVAVGIISLYTTSGAPLEVADHAYAEGSGTNRVMPSVTFPSVPGLLVTSAFANVGSSTPPGMTSVWGAYISISVPHAAFIEEIYATGATGTRTGTESSSVSRNLSLAVVESASLADPSDPVAVATGPTSIELTWSDNSDNEEGFTVERSLDGLTGWTEIYDAVPDQETMNNTGLSERTTYYYRVRAYNAGGESAWIEANATTALAAPTALSATAVSVSEIFLSWTDNSLVEDGFEIEWSENGTTGWSVIDSVGAGVTTYNDSGLTDAATHFYRVRALDGGVYSAYSNVDEATTWPLEPLGLDAQGTSVSTTHLSWARQSAAEDGVSIERSLDGLTSWTEVGTVAADVTEYDDSGLDDGTVYYYRLRAFLGSVYSTYSNVDDAETLPAFGPPSDLTATAIGVRRIQLTWSDNTEYESGYLVERSLTGTEGWVQIASLGINVANYVDRELQPQTTYYYRVRAYQA